MALDTSKALRNKIIYSVYVRNHGKKGSFREIIEDLPRIKALGTDILWLMPIHPIGVKNKKGDLGCPYAIRDLRGVNPEYGTLEDFKALIDAIHEHDMTCMIDVVFNHTAPDSELLDRHPEFYYRKENGTLGNKVGDWSDIIDLDYSNKNLWEEQISVLKYWVKLGIDGFRCDVAPLVPMTFWQKAREEVAEVKDNILWLSESVEPGFITYLRNEGVIAASDSEIYNAFDIAYDYDVHGFFKAYLNGEIDLEVYLDKVRQQEHIYPENYVKLRFLENHDQPRAAHLIPDERLLKIWTAYMYFQKGAVLLYAGQEAQDANTPSLFNADPVNWEGMEEEFVGYLQKLGEIKKQDLLAHGKYVIHTLDKKDVIFITYEHEGSMMAGIFNVGNKIGKIQTYLPEGSYKNILFDEAIDVVDGRIELREHAIVIEIKN